MADEHTCEYHLDAHDRLTFVGGSWASSAHDNAAPELSAASVLNRPIWDFIANGETQAIYEMLFDKVRRSGRTVRLTYRCDVADALRVFEMTLSPIDDAGVRVDNALVRSEPRPWVRLMDKSAPRSDEMVRICSWCSRVNLDPGRWVEIDEALSETRLFEGERLPQLTHGICPECAAKWFGPEPREGG